MLPDKEWLKFMAIDLTLEEMLDGIIFLKESIKDLRNYVEGYTITPHPDYNRIDGILNNISGLIEVYKKKLYGDCEYNPETREWRPIV